MFGSLYIFIFTAFTVCLQLAVKKVEEGEEEMVVVTSGDNANAEVYWWKYTIWDTASVYCSASVGC